MQRRYLWWSIALLFLLASSILVIIPGTHVLAHGAHASLYVGTPTPTPDASSTLQMAQQEENNIQTILSIINILVVVFPILIAVAGAYLCVGYFENSGRPREVVAIAGAFVCLIGIYMLWIDVVSSSRA